MSDHIEHKCSRCNSLLHHVEDCPQPVSDTPRTDAAILRYTGGEPVTFPRGINYTVDYQFAQSLERENNQLKQCAEALNRLWEDDEMGWIVGDNSKLKYECVKCGASSNDKEMPHNDGCVQGYIYKALALPAVQNALKGK